MIIIRDQINKYNNKLKKLMTLIVKQIGDQIAKSMEQTKKSGEEIVNSDVSARLPHKALIFLHPPLPLSAAINWPLRTSIP